MIDILDNILAALNSIEVSGKKNHEYLLIAMQNIEAIKKALIAHAKEDAHESNNQQGQNI